MKLDAARIRRHCSERNLTLKDLLAEAGVSRTAYYSLVRKDSVLPRTVGALAGALGVRPSDLLTEGAAETWRAQALLRRARHVVTRNPGVSFEDVWHTLVLLDELPIERLRRSLLRGRALDTHRTGTDVSAPARATARRVHDRGALSGGAAGRPVCHSGHRRVV